MTKEQAIQELCMLSDGTLAKLTGLRNYSDIEDVLDGHIQAISEGHVDVSECETWLDVWRKVE